MTDPDKIFDGLLVLEYRAGSKRAFNLLVSKYHLKLCKHSYWYTRDIDASKDIVQDCWKIIINKIDSLKEPNLFASWAMRIVTRKSLDFEKRNKRELERLQEFHKTRFSEDENDNVNQEPEIKKLRSALKLLPKKQQIVLQLFYTEDYTLKEISTILDISVGTVKSRLFHAREKLKTLIK